MKAIQKKIIILLASFISSAVGAYIGVYYWHRWDLSSVQQQELVFDIDRLAQFKNIVPVAVIGSGPAGLSAALYAARAKLHTVIFAGPVPGGQLTGTSHVENWPGIPKELGAHMMEGLKKQAQQFGAYYLNDTITQVDFSQWPFTLTTEGGTIVHALSVIIATGATPRKLTIPGEQEYWGKGVSTCAICDAPYYKDKNVIVIGGGDSALEEAFQLAAYAQSVTLVVRSNRLRASQIMQERLLHYPHIRVVYTTEVIEIIGNKQRVTGVTLFNNITHEQSALSLDGVFLAIGHVPNTQLFIPYLASTPNYYIKVAHPTQQTSVEGIFAAGDVVDALYRQAGVAAGDGIKAGLDAAAFLIKIGFNPEISRLLAPHYFSSTTHKPQQEPYAITTLAEFEREVLNASTPVIVDFYAPYCPSCMAMMPALRTVTAQFAQVLKVVKVDISTAPEIATAYDVSSLPVLMVFKHGVRTAVYARAFTQQQLEQLAQELI